MEKAVEPPPAPTPAVEKAAPPPADYVAPAHVARVAALAAELARRRLESLKLYEAQPMQEAFHRSRTRIRLARGSNRSGKTLCAAVEVALAVTGQDPYGKYPKSGGRFFMVGKNLDHVGQVMWQKLGRAGAFKMIRDLGTGNWRAYRPWDELDLAREAQAKPAPPLIPHRLIASIAWENKAKGIPKVVKLNNGWELCAYSSEGKPPNGVDLDGWWFDEEIVDEEWYPEMRARLLDRKGVGIWSATPQAGTEQLFQLHERAVEEAAKGGERSVEEFVLLIGDNMHIDPKEKAAFFNDVSMSPEQYRVRVEGEFAYLSLRMYPEYSPSIHTVPYFDVPRDWTRYMVVDPGHQVCAALFAAVPPPSDERKGRVYLYDELYLTDCNAMKFAEAARHKTTGYNFQAFIVDYHGSIRAEGGDGKTLLQHYTEAMRKKGVKSNATGSGFKFGSDDLSGGIEAVRGWLMVRENEGSPRLAVLREKLPNFEREMKYYRRRVIGGQVQDEPLKKHDHTVDCLRYLAMCDPKYVKPKKVESLSPVYRAFLKQKKDESKRGGGSYVRLGPPKR